MIQGEFKSYLLGWGNLTFNPFFLENSSQLHFVFIHFLSGQVCDPFIHLILKTHALGTHFICLSMKKLVFALNFMDMSRFMNMRSMGYVQLVSLDLVFMNLLLVNLAGLLLWFKIFKDVCIIMILYKIEVTWSQMCCMFNHQSFVKFTIFYVCLLNIFFYVFILVVLDSVVCPLN